jgi:hypothetical protein
MGKELTAVALEAVADKGISGGIERRYISHKWAITSSKRKAVILKKVVFMALKS